MYLAVLVRLSVLLHRDRGENTQPKIKALASQQKLKLSFPKDFFDKHPLTRVDLEQEQVFLKSIKFELEIE